MGPEALDFSGSRPAVLIYARSAQSLEERCLPLAVESWIVERFAEHWLNHKGCCLTQLG
jgi:hypothetical protein